MSHAPSPVRLGISIVATAMALATASCSNSGSNSNTGALTGVKGIVFLQRPLRNSGGNVFDYTSYEPG
ncbi:MAG: hypothetical protein ABIW57_07860, partial [Polyangia bacterium]